MLILLLNKMQNKLNKERYYKVCISTKIMDLSEHELDREYGIVCRIDLRCDRNVGNKVTGKSHKEETTKQIYS